MRLTFSRESVRREVGIRERDKRFRVLRCERLHEGVSRLVFSPHMELGRGTEWGGQGEPVDGWRGQPKKNLGSGRSEAWRISDLGQTLWRDESSGKFGGAVNIKEILPKVTGRVGWAGPGSASTGPGRRPLQFSC